MTYENSIYVLSGFLTVFGLFLIWLSLNYQGKKGTIKANVVMMFFACLYLAFAHFGLWSGIGYSLELSHMAPCENVIANTTEPISGNIIYSYTDSCATDTPPSISTNYFRLFSYLMLIDFIALMLGFTTMIYLWLMKW